MYIVCKRLWVNMDYTYYWRTKGWEDLYIVGCCFVANEALSSFYSTRPKDRIFCLVVFEVFFFFCLKQ